MSSYIGKPLSRLEGADKVTGKARFAADEGAPGILHAVIVPATHPHGRIARIDTGLAARSAGVIAIFTHANAFKFEKFSGPPLGHDVLPLQSDEVLYEGQPVALVVADTLERAIEAARLVRVEYQRKPFETDFRRRLAQGESLPLTLWEADSSTGNFAAAWQASPVKIERTYETADRHHNPIEPSSTLAIWHNDSLTVHDSVQGVMVARAALARALQLDPKRVRVRSEFVGGGFGCKGYVWPHQLLAAMAARQLGRAVKLTLTRANTYTAHGYQPATLQTFALCANEDGKLTGIRHDSFVSGSFVGHHVEGPGIGTRSLYACESIKTTHRRVSVHRGDPTPMRAPLEGVGSVALECAMDELAYELGMDPLALRLKNYADHDPTDGKPFSAKRLRECYERGARQFGWRARNPMPRSMRDGSNLIGYGMATAIFGAFRRQCKARISIDRDARVLIETSTQEIGTGSRTIMPQIVADVLGIAAADVLFAWGDTVLPEAPMTVGSMSAGSVGSAVHDGALKLKAKLTEAGASGPADYANAVRRLGVDRLAVDGEFAPARESKHALFSFGAVFAEVQVDELIPIPRVTRLVGVYDAGRIINPTTARSQMIGGLIWGIGQALLESSEMDHRLGRFLSKNLAGYMIPVNADVASIDASFIDEPDTLVNPIGAKGIGELGAIGVGAAIANAVYHATGIRVRETPIRPEHLLG